MYSDSRYTRFAALRRLAAIATISMLGFCTQASAEGSFTITGNMVTPRTAHVATRLLDGRVLIMGGIYPSWRPGPVINPTTELAELYDPVTGEFTNAGSMNVPRVDFVATLLVDGRVLVAGGYGDGDTQANAELYDPATDTFSFVETSLQIGGERTAATRLLDGRVLIIGGFNMGFRKEARLFDPVTNTFTATGDLNYGRYVHTVTLLQDGRVLVTGGLGSTLYNNAELYDPATGTFSVVASTMSSSRERHAATLLPDGRVLVAGGYTVGGEQLATADLFDPVTNTFRPSTSTMTTGRIDFRMRTLDNGKVFIVGSHHYLPKVATAELYVPATDTFEAILPGPATERAALDATVLADGRVLMSGGNDLMDEKGGWVQYGELYDPNGAVDAIFADGFDRPDAP